MTKRLEVLKVELEDETLKEFHKYADRNGITVSSFLEAKIREELKIEKVNK